MGLTVQRKRRYSRQMILPGVGEAGQEKLARARVLLIGAGGLGAPASLYLAAAGVGCLGIAERDRVELSNLHRQVLFGEADEGASKLQKTRERLQFLDSELRIEEETQGIYPGNALELVSRYDLVLDGSDNFGTRYLVNDACRLAGVPHLHGGIDRYSGMVTFFAPGKDAPCYRCIFPYSPDPDSVPNCAQAGVLGPLPGIIGSMMAMEAIKWILGVGEPLVGRIWQYNALTAKTREVRIKRSSRCPICGDAPEIQSIDEENYRGLDPLCSNLTPSMEEITVQQFAERLQQEDRPIVLDVREPDEVAFCALPDIVTIPLGSIPEQWEQLDPNAEYVVYCHHGRRSLNAVRFLQSKGFSRVLSLQGGIERWSLDIDASVPRY